jgi:hypothetical protein
MPEEEYDVYVQCTAFYTVKWEKTETIPVMILEQI